MFFGPTSGLLLLVCSTGAAGFGDPTYRTYLLSRKASTVPRKVVQFTWLQLVNQTAGTAFSGVQRSESYPLLSKPSEAIGC
jgi:hypothetical protein